MVVPGRIFATQWLKAPFPFPILTSIGFFVTGVWGCTLKIIRPRFLITLLTVCFKALSWLDVNNPKSLDFNCTQWQFCSSFCEKILLKFLPFCCFLNLKFFEVINFEKIYS